jgi:vesicle coat complex subunit
MIVSIDSPGNAAEIKSALQGNDIELKIDMLKKAIAMSLSGEAIPGLFICMIRYVLPSEDHTVQRLLLLYLVRTVKLKARRFAFHYISSNAVSTFQCLQETIERTDASGKLLPEMVRIVATPAPC